MVGEKAWVRQESLVGLLRQHLKTGATGIVLAGQLRQEKMLQLAVGGGQFACSEKSRLDTRTCTLRFERASPVIKSTTGC